MHHKKAITNMPIKPTSCIDPNIIKSVFKGFLYRALSKYLEKCIKEEEKFLINMFVENGHKKQVLKNLVIKYNKINNKNNHENNTENRDYKNLKTLPWVPNISPKIKCGFKKIGKDISFKLLRNSQPALPNNQSGRLFLQWEIYWRVKKEGSCTMHTTLTG